MSRKKKRWLIAIGVSVAAGLVAMLVAVSILSRRFEPFIREQAIQYMSERFDSDVQIQALRIHLPKTSPLNVMVARGRGVSVRVEGEGITMRRKGAPPDVPPLFAIPKFHFEVDLGTLFDTPKKVSEVRLEGLEINIPPKGERPKVRGESGEGEQPSPRHDPAKPTVLIEEVSIQDAKLRILPKDKAKIPLTFAIHQLRLNSAGVGVAMKYDAQLRNPKPPGEIVSKGTFGPWVSGEPGDSPLSGEYTFDNADLGVFAGIAGTLRSTGNFSGSLGSIQARGEATVPNFQLKMAGNPVPLSTRFEVLVDGTNGNTVLQPVHAKLGSTEFTTSGAVVKHDGDPRRTISLQASMPRGNLRDVLLLAMKGPPFMEGRLNLNTKILIPPLTGKVKEKLLLDGRFRVDEGKFLRSKIQEQIDSLSRRAQGQPENEGIDEVVSSMQGVFKLENEVLSFRKLAFGMKGANVDLAGTYNLHGDALNFRGTVKLQARVSQTMTGWKRWALKPVDPFFAKQGVGTFLRIKIEGSSREPKFGLDFGGGDDRKQTNERAGKTE